MPLRRNYSSPLEMKHMKFTILTARNKHFKRKSSILTGIKGLIFKYSLQVTFLKVRSICGKISHTVLAII